MGDRWLTGPEGTPLVLHHTTCGHDMHAVVVCSECDNPLDVRDVRAKPGPGYHHDSQTEVATVQKIHRKLLDARLDRSTTLISLGDSIIGDVTAFAAATYLRGVDVVHIPTELIAMIDMSVGGKVGLDVPHGRNLIGLFKQPRAVIADVTTLRRAARRFGQRSESMTRHGHAVAGGRSPQCSASRTTSTPIRGSWPAADAGSRPSSRSAERRDTTMRTPASVLARHHAQKIRWRHSWFAKSSGRGDDLDRARTAARRSRSSPP